MHQVTGFIADDGSCPYDEFYSDLKGGGVKNAQARVSVYIQKLREEGVNLLGTEMMGWIEDSIYELRPGPFRLFCYLDSVSGTFILLNGFRKKTQRTPESEKSKARVLVGAYLKQKEKRP